MLSPSFQRPAALVPPGFVRPPGYAGGAFRMEGLRGDEPSLEVADNTRVADIEASGIGQDGQVADATLMMPPEGVAALDADMTRGIVDAWWAQPMQINPSRTLPNQPSYNGGFDRGGA